MRGVDDRLRADDLRELRVDGVVRGDHRAREVDVAEIAPLVVRDLPDPVARVDLHRLRDEPGRRRDPLPERAREHDRLERRAGLPLGLRREVELAPLKVRPAEHRADGSRPRVDRDERRRRPARLREHLLDRLAGAVLEVEVDRRRHLEPAAEDALGAVAGDELVGHVPDEVRRRPACPRETDGFGLRHRRLVGLPLLCPRDAALLVELLEHEAPPRLRRRRVPDRVVARGALRDAGEQRRLGERQFGRALPAEVRSRRLEDPVGPVSEVHGVEVGRENPVLRPALGELPGERRLAHLARDGLLVAAVGVLHVLLRDGRAALDDALAADVLPEGAHDAAKVDSVVLVEALVLDDDDRLLHDRRDRLGADEHAALVAAQDGEHAPLPGPVRRRVDDGVDVALRARGIERGELAPDRGHEPEAECGTREREEDEEQRSKAALADPATLRCRVRTSSQPQSRKSVPPTSAPSGDALRIPGVR